MLLTCPTPYAVLVCAVADASGVLRIAVDAASGETPGLRFAVVPLIPINIQLAGAAAAFFGTEVGRHLNIEQDYADAISRHDGDTTLYLSRLDPAAGIVASAEWLSIPALLRQLTGRARIPYLRAWQVLAGGLTLATKAVDAAAALKHLTD
jgi:hypothetical protein